MTKTSGKRILVTDDESDIVDIITGMLRHIGYETLKAYSGKECIEVAAGERPDLIFLDIMMENMDGWEVATEIKNDPQLKEIPIIMVTAKPLTLEDVRDRAQLIENYIMKPVSIATLKEAVEDIFTAKTRVERIIEIARKSGVKSEMIEELKDRYLRIYTQNRTNQKLLVLLSQIYTEKRLEDNPGWKNTMASLKKGIEHQDEELERLEKIIMKPQK
ncbi:response regulator [Methanocella sp. CWC-04]|uniref:Response regulator n=1 Tax=Methanooceanicella nereidis TaxID=2052831 RepID=A0AAP2W5K7_9EURY|nr:response regulator [Methanocella sp. CWC-04]MCD1294418.1 response regulator [Methanocella sp. CWC-04]